MTLDDDASAREELDRSICLKQRKPEYPKTGVCNNDGCGEPTTGSFCCPECREDTEKRVNLNRGNNV